MVHPNKTKGRKITPLDKAFREFGELIKREFDKDATYRDSQDEAIKRVYFGDPGNINETPSLSLEMPGVNFKKSPQDSGSDAKVSWKIRYYGGDSDREDVLFQTIRAALTIKLIIVDNDKIPTKDGTKNFVFSTSDQDFNIEFGIIEADEEAEYSGLQIAELLFVSDFSETGY